MQRPLTHFSRPFPVRPSTHPQCGMALMEVLVSLLVFSFGVLGLIGLEARVINFSVDAEDRNRAALFANDIASSMWLAGSVTVDATTNPTLAQWQARVSNVTQGGLPGGAVLNIVRVGATTNSTDISISWRPPSRAANDDLSTLTTRVILP